VFSGDVEPGRSIRWGVAILAAGASVRMGCSKLVLPWGRSSVAGRVLRLARTFPAAQVAFVIAEDDDVMNDELRRLRVPLAARITNPEPQRGMFSSVQGAARWEGWRHGLTHWAVMLGDQPQLDPATLTTLVAFAVNHPRAICQPARNGRPRHPVVLPERAFRRLATTRSLTLRDFLDAHRTLVRLVECPDPGLDLDLDSPDDYRRLRPLGSQIRDSSVTKSPVGFFRQARSCH
jgi:molybdenum cofactor cytidylyltransferase